MKKTKKCARCKALRKALKSQAEGLIERYTGMGFHHNPERAKGIVALMNRLDIPPPYKLPYQLSQVAGIMPVTLDSDEWQDVCR